jgi:TolA-binding protein
MKIVDLHPEDLLDKDARGDLSDVEKERLDAHLERCSTCRFERQVRADFADEEEIEKEEERAPITPRRARRRSYRIPLLVAAALLVGGVAGAGVGIDRISRLAFGEEATMPARTHEPVMPPAPVAPAPTPTELELSPPIDEPPAPVETVAPRVVVAPSPPVAVERPGPGALFDAAGDARRRGDHARALEIHRELVARFPNSREARVSHATVGQLLLDRGDASGALASFDAYRAGGAGPLDEPVIVGRASALERLGRTEEARNAWRNLLDAFPKSPYAQHARTRLEATTTP